MVSFAAASAYFFDFCLMMNGYENVLIALRRKSNADSCTKGVAGLSCFCRSLGCFGARLFEESGLQRKNNAVQCWTPAGRPECAAAHCRRTRGSGACGVGALCGVPAAAVTLCESIQRVFGEITRPHTVHTAGGAKGNSCPHLLCPTWPRMSPLTNPRSSRLAGVV